MQTCAEYQQDHFSCLMCRVAPFNVSMRFWCAYIMSGVQLHVCGLVASLPSRLHLLVWVSSLVLQVQVSQHHRSPPWQSATKITSMPSRKLATTTHQQGLLPYIKLLHLMVR